METLLTTLKMNELQTHLLKISLESIIKSIPYGIGL